MKEKLVQLEQELKGELKFDNLYRGMYATDASVYRKLPLGVAFPKSVDDIKLLIQFARENNTSLIPRTAGTSSSVNLPPGSNNVPARFQTYPTSTASQSSLFRRSILLESYSHSAGSLDQKTRGKKLAFLWFAKKT